MWANISLIVLSASLLGARLSYVWINWAHFSGHLGEIPQIWLGGLTWPGAVVGAWLAILALPFLFQTSRSRGAHPGRLPPVGWFADRLYPLLPPIAVTAWLANWQAGVAYGVLLPAGSLLGMPSLDETGSYNPHFPLQLLAALSLLADFWLMEMRARPLRRPGQLSRRAFFRLLLNLLVVSLLRADPAPLWNGLRVDAWIALIFLAAYLSYVVLTNLLSQAGKRQNLAGPEQSPF
jgi:prolipoprotein diacylglyceryltransferase